MKPIESILAVIVVAACGSNPGAAPSNDAGPDAAQMPAADGSAPNPDSASNPDGAAPEAGPLPPDPCIEAGSCPPGTWIDVTPANAGVADLTRSCSNYGVGSVQVSSANPSVAYAQFNCYGIWKSTDYGLTWDGP